MNKSCVNKNFELKKKIVLKIFFFAKCMSREAVIKTKFSYFSKNFLK